MDEQPDGYIDQNPCRTINGQVDKDRHVVKPRFVDIWLVRPIQKQKERNGYMNG
jgi:hypothetical protein